MAKQNLIYSGGTPDSLPAGSQKTKENFDELYADAHVHAIASATTPINADEIGYNDSADSFALKKTTWTLIKAFLKTYFDAIYNVLTGAIYIVAADGTRRAYGSLTAAQDAAENGDTIFVERGDYTFPANRALWKDGVYWHFAAGVEITQIAAQSDTLSILTDAVGVSSKILGKGKFILDRTGNGSTAALVQIAFSSIAAGDYFRLFQADGSQVNVYFTIDGIGNPPTGRVQVETITVQGVIDPAGAGDAKITVTGAGMNGGSPFILTAAVNNDDSADAVAAALTSACQADSRITDLYGVTNVGPDIIFTALLKAANDATLNMEVDNDTCIGLSLSGSVDTIGGAANIEPTAAGDIEVALTGTPTNDEVAEAVSLTTLTGYSLVSLVGNVVTLSGSPAGLRATTTTPFSAHIGIGHGPGSTMSYLNLLESEGGSDLEIDFEELELIFDGVLEVEANIPSIIKQDGPMRTFGNVIRNTGDFINGLYWINGQTRNNIRHIQGGYIGVWTKCIATPTGDFHLDYERIECVATDDGAKGWPIYANGSQATAALWFRGTILKHPGHHTVAGGGASAAIYHSGAEKLYFGTINKVYGPIYWSGGGGQLYCHIEKLQPAQNAHGAMIYGPAGSAGNINIDLLELTGFTGCVPTDFEPSTKPIPLRIGYFRAPSGSGPNVKCPGLYDSFFDYTDCANVNGPSGGAGGGSGSAANRGHQGCKFITSGTAYDVSTGNVAGCYGSGANGLVLHNGAFLMESHALKRFLTAAGTTGSSGADETLMSFTLAGYSLGTNGDSIRAVYDITTAAHATATRKLKVLWGGTTIFDSGAVATVAAANVRLEVSVIRLTSTTARALVALKSGHATLVDMTIDTSLTGQTFSSSIDLVLKGAVGTGGSSGDISAKFGNIDFDPAVA